MPTIRPAALADAAAWAEVVAATSPTLVQDARSGEHEMRTEPSDVVRLVAEQDGAVVGNDGSNAPMVAVNDRLGYRPFAAPRVGVLAR